MWWMQLIQAVVQMGLAQAQADGEENQRNAFMKMARAEGGAAADLNFEEAQRVRGRAATLAAASGGGISGSALNVLDDLGRQSMFKVRSAIYSAETDAQFGTRVSNQSNLAAAGVNAAVPLLSQWSSQWAQKQGGANGSNAGVATSLAGSLGGGGGGGGMGGGISSGLSALGSGIGSFGGM